MKKFTKILALLLFIGALLSVLVIAPAASGAVARIGEVEYDTLEEAWADANVATDEPITITILSDLSVANICRVTAKGANVIVDLNYHTLTASKNIDLFTVDADASLTLKNGNLISTFTVVETCVSKAKLSLDNIVIKKPSDNTTSALVITGNDAVVDIKDTAVYATRCILISSNGITVNAERLVAMAGESNALRFGGNVFFGEYNFTECVFSSTGAGRPIEVPITTRNITPDQIGGKGETFESVLVDQSGTVETYEITESLTGVINLYNCSVLKNPDTSAAMLIKPGLFKCNLYGGFYASQSAKTLFNNTYVDSQALSQIELFAYETESGTVFPTFQTDPSVADQKSRIAISNFHTAKVNYTYDTATGIYSALSYSITDSPNKSTVVEIADGGKYKYAVVPHGKTYSEYQIPTDPTEAVARIGSTFFKTFDEANAAAKSDDIIVLTADVTNAVAINKCLLNTSGYSITFSPNSPYSAFDLGSEFKAIDKALSVTVKYWKSESAYNAYKTSSDASGLSFTMTKSISESADKDFSQGYCTVNLSYYKGSDYYLHTGWVLASENDTEINYIPTFTLQGDLFAVYRKDGSLLKTGKTPAQFQTEMLYPTESGETIKMLGDIALPKINQAINAAYKSYTLDVNGYTLSVGDGAGSGAMYKTYKNIDITITSSRKGGVINNIYKNGSSAQMFWCAAGSSGKVTINGENLTVYTGTLLYCTASADVEFEVNGGTYIMRRATSSGFIVLTGTGKCDLTVNDATLISALHNLLALGKSTAPNGKTNVSFNRSTVIADAKPLLNLTTGSHFDSDVRFTDCNLAVNFNSQNGVRITADNGCVFNTPYEKDLPIQNSLTEIDPIIYEDYSFAYTTSPISSLAVIEWQIGEGVRRVYAEPRDTELSFSYSVTEDYVKTTYTGKASAKLEAAKTYTFSTTSVHEVFVEGIKYNLTLASNMNVNIAIPRDAYAYIEATYLGEPLVGEYTIIGTGDYYVVSVSDMNAISTANYITVKLNIDGAVSQSVRVSIAGYARRLMERGGEGTVESELGRGILQYSFEAYRLLAPEDTEAIELLKNMLLEFEPPQDVTFNRTDTSALAKYFKGAHLRLTSNPGIVFTLADSLDALECDISYTDVNGNVVTEHFSLSKENREAVIDGIKAYEFDSPLTVTVDGAAPMTYSLESYLASESVGSELAQAIYRYVEATKAYMESTKVVVKLSSLTLCGEDITGAVIIAGPSDKAQMRAAYTLRNAIYTYTGILLEVEGNESSADRKILISVVSDAGEDNFRAFVDGGNLVLECEYYEYLVKGVEMFVYDTLAVASGEFDFGEEYLYEGNARYVRYSEFGAVCDGFTNDLPAIIETHRYANANGMRVEADYGAVYYIGFVADEAIVKTDTNWRNARFFIDDRDVTLEQKNYWIFKITSDTPTYNIPVPSGLAPKVGDTNIGMTFDKDVMLTITNSGEKVYIRYGNNANNGNDKHEVIIVDKNGNIDESTPLIFDYKAITSIQVHALDDAPITVQGGDFTTYSNRQFSTESNYFNRGISVQRSNTTLYNIIHRVEKEPESENALRPYAGFYNVTSTYNVTIDSCVVTGHATNGTYDILSNASSHVTWKNCTQLNDINDTKYWGVMASNYSKNLSWYNCVMSRFDAHCGVHNVVIKDCEIGEVINLVGSGTALIENTTRSGKANGYFIRLREDYGSTWNGKIVIKNCSFTVSTSSTEAYVIRADWNEHYFGYDCHLPDIEIDGLSVSRVDGGAYTGKFCIIKNPNSAYKGDIRNDATNPLRAPSSISLKNVKYDDILGGTNNDALLTDTVIKED